MKVFALVAIVWNGGVGHEGVLSKTLTYSSMENCQSQIASMVNSIKSQFPINPYKVQCLEVDIPEIVENI